MQIVTQKMPLNPVEEVCCFHGVLSRFRDLADSVTCSRTLKDTLSLCGWHESILSALVMTSISMTCLCGGS